MPLRNWGGVTACPSERSHGAQPGLAGPGRPDRAGPAGWAGRPQALQAGAALPPAVFCRPKSDCLGFPSPLGQGGPASGGFFSQKSDFLGFPSPLGRGAASGGFLGPKSEFWLALPIPPAAFRQSLPITPLDPKGG